MAYIYSLPVFNSLSNAWSKIYGTKSQFWIGIVCLIIIMLAVGFVKSALSVLWPPTESLIDVLGQVICYFLQLGLLYMGIQRAFDRPISYEMIFRPFKMDLAIKIICLYFLEVVLFLIPAAIFLISSALMDNYPDNSAIGLVGIIGFLISFILFVFILIRISLSMGFVLDRGQNPWMAIKSSFKATRHNFWRLVFIHILYFFLLAISLIPLGIGLIWTIPFGLILYGVIYKSLLVNVITE